MSVGGRLRTRRERFALTQEWVANALGVPRELLSYWETGTRTPSAKHLRNLARVYRTTAEELLEGRVGEVEDPLELLGAEVESEEFEDALRSWSAFLERWSGFLREDLGRSLPGPATPPAALAEPALVVDRRRASGLAARVRAYWDLGRFAVPELYDLLDRKGVLLVRKELGVLGVGKQGLSGVFFNHAELGFCVVVNVNATPARQVFTLAHGIAHALFHYPRVGIVCRVMSDVREERFADTFGEEFLMPGKELRRQVAEMLRSSYRETLEPMHGVALANLFRVSFPTMAMRLVSEHLITGEMYDSWRQVDGRDLAERLGMEPPGFPEDRERNGPLSPYPTSVLTTVATAVSNGAVSVERAAEVLDVERTHIEDVLLAPAPEAKGREREEHDEFHQIHR